MPRSCQAPAADAPTLAGMPDLADLDALGAAAVYLVVIGFVFVECGLLVGFFLPGDTLLFAGGLVAADAVRGVELGWLMAGVLVAAIAGETSRLSARRPDGAAAAAPAAAAGWSTPERVARAEAFTDRYGVLAIISARWIPWVRTFAPLLAGATRMTWPKFLVGQRGRRAVLGADAGAGRLPGRLAAVVAAHRAGGRGGGRHDDDPGRRNPLVAGAAARGTAAGSRRPVASSGCRTSRSCRTPSTRTTCSARSGCSAC